MTDPASSYTQPKRALAPGVHVILGDSAAGVFRRVFETDDRLLIAQDVLNCGPTPKCADLEAWTRLRSEFWRELVPGEIDEFVPSPCELVANVNRLREAERVHVWAATGVSEQLFIAFVLHLVDTVGADFRRLSVLQYENRRDGRSRILGTGELNEQAMSHHPEPVPLSDEAAKHYRDAWNALTSEDPTHIEEFAGTHPHASRWLKEAMQLMLRRFPDELSGLPYWDRMLLSKVRECGPKATRVIGYTMTDCYDDGDLIGDWYLFGRLLRLGDERLPSPLLKLSGDRKNMRHTEVALTPFGEAVLDGKASNYRANPIDDWAAGVKLSSADGVVWFNDNGKLIRG